MTPDQRDAVELILTMDSRSLSLVLARIVQERLNRAAEAVDASSGQGGLWRARARDGLATAWRGFKSASDALVSNMRTVDTTEERAR